MATDTQSKFLWAIVLIMAALVALVAFKSSTPISVNTSPQPQQDLVTVSGTHQMDVAPDQAVMTFQVQTRGTDAKSVSSQNGQLMNAVMAALKAQGVSTDQIETTGVLLDRWTEWDQQQQKTVDKGYQQTTTIKVTLTDLTKVGPVLDAAVNAGANSVPGISFELQPATEQQYREQALKDATLAAKSKAQTLASAAGISLGKVASLNENSNIVPWIYNTKAVMAGAALDSAAAPTPISPQKVTVSATVSMAYEIA